MSRHLILAEPAADTIQYRCLLFGCWRRGVRIYTVSYFPLATRQVHTQVYTIHAVYVDDEMSWPWVAPSLFTCSVLHLLPRRRWDCCYAKGKVILEKSRPVLLYATTHPGNIYTRESDIGKMHRDGAKLLKKEKGKGQKRKKKKKRKTFADVYYQTTRLASQSFAILNRSESRCHIITTSPRFANNTGQKRWYAHHTVDGSSGCWIWVRCSSQGSFLDFLTLQYYIDTIGDLVFGYVFIFFFLIFPKSFDVFF